MTFLNARIWAMWTVAVSLPALFSRNPFYLMLALLAVAVIRSHIEEDNLSRTLPVWRLGMFMIVVAVLWNALTVHYGETLLLTLPAALPLIGGRVTLEAVVFGFTNGLAVWLFFAAFSTFSLAVTPYQMLSLAPRVLRHAGLVVSIALSFFPQALRSAREVREAQAVRGYRPRRLRDLSATIIPLLLNGLEDAAQLAEAMEARGYGRASAQPSSVGWIALIVGSLIQLYWRDSIVGWIIIAFSMGWLIVSGRGGVRVTRYRRERWSAIDMLVGLAAVASMGLIAAVSLSDPSALAYYPYPHVALPPLNPLIFVALLALLAPVVSLLRLSLPGREATSEMG